MKSLRKSKKQLQIEREVERNAKRKEFEAEHYDHLKEWTRLGLQKQFPLDPIEEYVEQKLREWDKQQLIVPTGKYQDPEKLRSEYQQKFVWYIQQCCPDAIEDLRRLVPLFQQFFGQHADQYNLLFDRFKTDIFFNLDQSLNQQVNLYCLKSNFLTFRPDRFKNFRYAYNWGEYRTLLQVLLLDLSDNSTEYEELKEDTSNRFERHTGVIWSLIPDDQNRNDVETDARSQAATALDELLTRSDGDYFFRRAEQELKRFFQGVFSENEPCIQTFLKLQIGLLNWAEQFQLEKDWLLRYAYDFLLKYSSNPQCLVSEMDIPYLQVRSLATYPFDFKFEGWFAGDERKEDFEKRLRAQFDTELSHYFHNISLDMGLKRRKRITRPPKFHRVKWLVFATVFGLSKSQVLDRLAEESYSQDQETEPPDLATIYKAFNQFKEFNLPIPA